MTIYKDTCATKDMADSNFIANHATLGNYVHEKEITLLDYNIGMARTEMTKLLPPRSSYRPGFIILPHFSYTYKAKNLVNIT